MAAGASDIVGGDDIQADNPAPGIANPPTAPPQAGAVPGQPAADPTQAPTAPALPGAQPPAGGIESQKKKGVIPTGPDVKFDEKKLAKVQTAQDLVEAMRPKSRTEYIDWWEKQHGDIDKRYDQLQQQLGPRPQAAEAKTREEKFADLLQLGLHIMRASAPAHDPNQGGAVAGAIQDELGAADKRHQANVQAPLDEYDKKYNAIEQGRQLAQKGIGSPADARKAQMTSDKDYAAETKDNAAAYKSVAGTLDEKGAAARAPTYSTAGDGTLHVLGADDSGNPIAKPVMGIDGKPYKGKVLGRAAGSGIDKTDTAAQRNHKYLTSVLGLPDEVATQIAFKPKTNNPMADHTSIYKSVYAATQSTDSAKLAADQYVLDNYGAGALTRANAPIAAAPAGAQGGPPAQAVAGMHAGDIRDFGPKGKWQMGVDGKPHLVGNTPALAAPQGQ